LAFILKDCGSTILIAARRFHESVEKLSALHTDVTRVIWTGQGALPAILESLDYEESLKAEFASVPPQPDIADDEVAHLYYTSGTTGRPKGVMLSHKNVCTHAIAAIAELKLGDYDNWIHVAQLFHLADAWATFAITWVGGKHVIVSDFDPPHVLSTMAAEKVTISNMIPTMLNALVNTPGVETFDFSSLRVLLSGGAPIAPELVKKIMKTFRCDYVRTYGITETSPYLTVSILKDKLRELPEDEQFVL